METVLDMLVGSMREAISRPNNSVSAIAAQAGLPRRSVQAVLDGHVPSVSRAAEICEALGLRLYIDTDLSREAVSGAVAPPAADSFARFDPNIDMTVIGWAKCSLQGALEGEREFLDLPAPVDIRAYDDHSFYAIAKGQSMVPEGIRNGDYCLVSPNTEPTPGVRVWFKDREDRATIKRLVAFDDETYSLRGWLDLDPATGKRQSYNDQWMRDAIREQGVILAVYRGRPNADAPPPLIPDPRAPPVVDRGDEPVRESDLSLPALRFLAAAPDGFLSTADLISALEALFNPTGKDAERIPSRTDTHFAQKVRNIVSHRETANNPIEKGWIDYRPDKRGLAITKAGRAVLASFTFGPSDARD